MSLKIYHNPRCSKSRKTLEIVLECPIVVDTDSGRAVVGRPPENVNELLR